MIVELVAGLASRVGSKSFQVVPAAPHSDCLLHGAASMLNLAYPDRIAAFAHDSHGK
jgi:hypothetical protein